MSLSVAETSDIAAAVLDRRVSHSMLAAGRRAFLANRSELSDLYEFFEMDLNSFLASIYLAMSRAA